MHFRIILYELERGLLPPPSKKSGANGQTGNLDSNCSACTPILCMIPGSTLAVKHLYNSKIATDILNYIDFPGSSKQFEPRYV